jgi:hypothetical protein
MKGYHLSVEEVSEYAKYIVLTGRTWQFERDQLYLFAKQHHKQLILSGQYEYAVTDSPLSLCAFYAPETYLSGFFPLVEQARDSFENINFYLTRDLASEHFEDTGRVHNRQASIRVDAELREYLARHQIPFQEMPLDRLTPWRIVDAIKPGLVDWPKFGDV